MAAPAHGDVHSEPTAHAEIRVSRAWAYVAVFVFASAAMWLALAVARGGMGAASAWTLIVLLAVLAIVVQLFGLLEIGACSRRWHALVLLMTLPLFVLSVGLTAWMFHGLMLRTMLMH